MSGNNMHCPHCGEHHHTVEHEDCERAGQATRRFSIKMGDTYRESFDEINAALHAINVVLDKAQAAPLSRREQFALAALPAIYTEAAAGIRRMLDDSTFPYKFAKAESENLPATIAEAAVKQADALIAALDGEDK